MVVNTPPPPQGIVSTGHYAAVRPTCRSSGRPALAAPADPSHRPASAPSFCAPLVPPSVRLPAPCHPPHQHTASHRCGPLCSPTAAAAAARCLAGAGPAEQEGPTRVGSGTTASPPPPPPPSRQTWRPTSRRRGWHKSGLFCGGSGVVIIPFCIALLNQCCTQNFGFWHFADSLGSSPTRGGGGGGGLHTPPPIPKSQPPHTLRTARQEQSKKSGWRSS